MVMNLQVGQMLLLLITQQQIGLIMIYILAAMEIRKHFIA